MYDDKGTKQSKINRSLEIDHCSGWTNSVLLLISSL